MFRSQLKLHEQRHVLTSLELLALEHTQLTCDSQDFCSTAWKKGVASEMSLSAMMAALVAKPLPQLVLQ